MKRIAFTLIPALLIGVLVLSCSDLESPTASPDASVNPLSKVNVVEYSFPVTMDYEPPYQNCSTNAPMKNYGTVRVHIRELTTPSNNLIVTGWVDYNAFNGVTLKNMSTNEIWTLVTGINPFGEVIKENGYYMLHYQWSELYKNSSNATFHIHLKGHIKIDNNGHWTIDRESYTCR